MLLRLLGKDRTVEHEEASVPVDVGLLYQRLRIGLAGLLQEAFNQKAACIDNGAAGANVAEARLGTRRLYAERDNELLLLRNIPGGVDR